MKAANPVPLKNSLLLAEFVAVAELVEAKQLFDVPSTCSGTRSDVFL